MLLTDLRELKAELLIPAADSSQDKVLNFYIEQASKIIEDFLNRGDLAKQARTEYYSGPGTQELVLKHRPAYADPVPVVYASGTGHWGQTSGGFGNDAALTYGDDYCLVIDQPDGTSRCGVLRKLKGYWERPFVRQAGYLTPFVGLGNGNLKVTYTAGYTVDNLPAAIRFACGLLVSRMRTLMPYGAMLTSESYEERSVSYFIQKDDLLSLVRGILSPYRTWTF